MEPAKPKLETPSETLVNREGFRLRQVTLPAILYAIAFDAAEVVTYQIRDFAGIIFYFAILMSLIIHSATQKNEAERKLWLALGLVPLIRIVSLAILLAVFAYLVIIWAAKILTR